jgi:hypothetical protein
MKNLTFSGPKTSLIKSNKLPYLHDSVNIKRKGNKTEMPMAEILAELLHKIYQARQPSKIAALQSRNNSYLKSHVNSVKKS